MLVGLFAIPRLIEGMGKERFGLLAIIWMGVGYFSLFDMGFGRALTKLVAERLGSDDRSELGGIIWTALWAVFGLSLIGAGITMIVARPLIVHLLNVPAALHQEGVTSFRLLGASLPFIVATSALVGILEAHQKFARIAAIRVPLGVMTFLGPLLTLLVTPSLVAATIALIVARAVAFVLYCLAAARVNPALRSPSRPVRRHVRPLLSFGGWLTVSTVVGPVMLYTDRFLIGSLLTMAAVAFYTTPYEVLSRLQVLPQALFGVLFPAIAIAYASDARRLARLYDRATETLLLTMVPVLAGLFLFAPELLALWLGQDFSQAAAPVARWLALGWLHVIVARTNSTVLQATGRPDLLAKAHLGEIFPYLGMLWWLTARYGITGAALAWCLRGVADAFILAALAALTVPSIRKRVYFSLTHLPLMWLGFSGLALIESLSIKIAVAVVLLAVCGLLALKPLRQLLVARTA